MRIRPLLRPVLFALIAVLVAAGQGGSQGVPPPPGLPDFLGLARLGDFTAWRSSSNNPDPASNDDSKRPIPGETVVLADLEGPGVVSHIWLTVAASEYGWPRLLRLRVYYDGSPAPSVDAPLGDFFAVGHGFEDGLRAAGIFLFAAQHAAQALRLVSNQLIQVRVIDGDSHLPGNGFDQVQQLRAEIIRFAMEHHQHADHIFCDQQRHGNCAAVLA